MPSAMATPPRESAVMIGHGMRGRLLVLGLGGSLARVSRSRAALATALAGAASAGAGTQLLDLRELRPPMYDPDDHHPTEAARRLIEACYSADGLLWSSPMYQGTVSGAFKNARDRRPRGWSSATKAGRGVVRVAEKFAGDQALHRQVECDRAAERVASAS